ncbi:hypothetical protein CBR_g9083 [Chara braunii]|uniref:Reverse transcriptase domain-containing protein n=1 Tax=Chara braunii TaxID=69332 RepID=A0A388KNT9_CHABU|nr:hypothetical protein CBR_g9083 [Chara braunii]|eukprot:GBG71668.1 hypothetical protein CBR_g9083 [Chara braunii]
MAVLPDCKGKKKMNSPSASSESEPGTKEEGDNNIALIRRTRRTVANEKRKRSAEETVGSSPPVMQPAKTPRATNVRPVRLATKLQTTTKKTMKKKTPTRFTPRRGTPRTKIAAQCGPVGRAKYVVENMRVLSECGADELKEICKKEEVEYGNKTIAAMNIDQKRAEEAYGSYEEGEANTDNDDEEVVQNNTEMRIEGHTEERTDVFSTLADLEKRGIRKGIRKFTLTSAGGNAWVEGWKKITKAFGSTSVSYKGLPYPRIGEHVRFRLHELSDIHPMLCNAKNVLRSSHPDRATLLRREIEEAFDRWPNRDRNTGETLVLCPFLYHEAMMSTFMCNTGYRIVKTEERCVLEEMKSDLTNQGLKQCVKIDMKGTFGCAYVQPKHKDLDRYRPICPSYCEPTVKFSRCEAKALNHLLFALPASWHFNLQDVSGLVPRIKKLNQKLLHVPGANLHISTMSYDIKDMFSKLPHEDIMQAAHWIINHFIGKGKTTVRVNPRGRGNSFGRTTGADHWRAIDLEDLRRFVEFDLRHTYIKATSVTLRQVVGIPMGKSTSPPLACIMCVHVEYKFLREQRNASCKIFGIRLVDDVSLVIAGRRNTNARVEQILKSFESCYPSNLTLKRTDDGGGCWEFLGVEMRTQNVFPYMGCIQMSKNEKTVWTEERLEFKIRQGHFSWGSKAQKSAVIASRLHRIDRNMTVRCELPDKVLTLSRELRLMDVPSEFFLRVLKRFATGRGPTWGYISSWLAE